MDPRAFAHELLAEYRDEIMQVVQDLIRMPSRNMPPGGEELACQEYLARYLGGAGLADRTVRTGPGAGHGRASVLLAGTRLS